jgi:hypothetical protein
MSKYPTNWGTTGVWVLPLVGVSYGALLWGNKDKLHGSCLHAVYPLEKRMKKI